MARISFFMVLFITLFYSVFHIPQLDYYARTIPELGQLALLGYLGVIIVPIFSALALTALVKHKEGKKFAIATVVIAFIYFAYVLFDVAMGTSALK